MSLANMRMASKLGVGFALVLVLTLALGSVALWQMKNMNSSTQKAVNHAMPSVENVSNLEALWNRFRRIEAGMLNVRNVQELSEFESQAMRLIQEIETAERRYESLERNPTERELLAQYVELRKQFLESHQSFLQAAREKDYEQPEGDLLLGDVVTNLYSGTAEANFAALVESLAKIGSLSLEDAQVARQQVVQSYQIATVWVLIGMGLSVVAAVLLGILITRAVTGPAGHALRVAQSITEGDLTQPIPAGSRDEMGALLNSLTAMRDSLSHVVGDVRANAEGVSTASEQIASGNADLSSRTEEQASALQQTAASMEQLSSTVRQNADSAHQASQLALNASVVAGHGGEVVGRVVQTMKGIDSSSKKIADIIGVIDGIAFQTNILALNAAVEAARAGEQGRGFAVVAAEVRALAGRSADAAKQIKVLIDDSVQRVGEGTALVGQAGETMSEVVQSIRNVSDLVGEISAASKEQSQGVGQVSDTIAQMDQTTQQNAALVEESAAAAEGLKRQALELVAAVASFKVQGGASPSSFGRPVESSSRPPIRPVPSLHASVKSTVKPSEGAAKTLPTAQLEGKSKAESGTASESDWANF